MKLVITLNQSGLMMNSMNINNTGYTLTAMYSELSDIMKDAVSYYPDILANVYFENYEDIDEDEYESDEDLEVKFIEMPYISGAIDGILEDIILFKKIFEKMNNGLTEEESYKFDPMIFLVVDGKIKDAIIKKMNNFFIRNNMDLEVIDYLEYCKIESMKKLGEIIKMNYNNSMFYEDDSLLSAYSITKSLTVTNGVYDMGY
jgi:uncharacterized protein YegL